MILWTVDDEIPKFLAIVCWETFLNCWAICSRSSPQSGDPRPILDCEWQSLLGMLILYPIMTLTCFQLTCSSVEFSKQVILSIPQLSRSFVAPVPSNSKSVNICKKTTKFISLNIKYLVFLVYSIEYRLKMICKSFNSVFFFLTQRPNFIGFGVVWTILQGMQWWCIKIWNSPLLSW